MDAAPDAAPEKTIYTLSQLGRSLKRTLEQVTAGKVMWFRAEIAELNRSGSEHLYLSLVEEREGRPVAKMKASIWRNQLQRIREELGEAADQVLAAGSEIVFSGQVTYHEVWGLNFIIDAVDLDAILGEAERRKQATIATLKAEGAMETNRALPLPSLTQRIALIGSPGTSGFRDFVTHLLRNEWRLAYELEVFPATVQGKDAPATVIDALRRAEAWRPDAIVLVRGGGSSLDLDAFNDLGMCRAIAASSLPVLTGIGHETDLSVADMVAHAAFKTPTAVADFLVDKHLKQWGWLADWAHGMRSLVTHQMGAQRTTLARHAQTLQIQPQQHLRLASTSLDHMREQIQQRWVQWMERHTQQLARMEASVQAMSPEATLQRGFSVVRAGDRVIKHASDLNPGDELTIQLHRGRVRATTLESKS